MEKPEVRKMTDDEVAQELIEMANNQVILPRVQELFLRAASIIRKRGEGEEKLAKRGMLKGALEAEIYIAIEKFELETNVCVDEIFISHLEGYVETPLEVVKIKYSE